MAYSAHVEGYPITVLRFENANAIHFADDTLQLVFSSSTSGQEILPRKTLMLRLPWCAQINDWMGARTSTAQLTAMNHHRITHGEPVANKTRDCDACCSNEREMHMVQYNRNVHYIRDSTRF